MKVGAAVIAKVQFVQPDGNVSGLGVGKVMALRTTGDYNLVSSVQKELHNGSYDIQI